MGNCTKFLHQGKELMGEDDTEVTAENRETHRAILLPFNSVFKPTEIIFMCDGSLYRSLLFYHNLCIVLAEPNFKVFTDTDTPSGNASILQAGGGVESVLNSTEIAAGEAQRPNPNISVIPTQSSDQPDQPPTSQQSTGLPNGSSASDTSSSASSAGTGISCSLCGMAVRGQGYLSQHVNKKKCTERQRLNKEQQEQLEASIARMSSLRVSDGDTLNNSDISKVF